MNIAKVKGTIEVDCRKCINLQNNGCIPYGENPNVAVKKCADDCFVAYVTYEELEKCEKESNISDEVNN